MEKTKMLVRAKSYLELLSNGIDPISGESVPEDTALNQERLKRCFSFVAEVLDEAIKNYGLISLPENEKNAAYEVTKKKVEFSIAALPLQSVHISAVPITPTAFVKNINAAVNKEEMEKLSSTSLNKWLLKQGLVTESKEPTVVNRTVRHTTPDAVRLGIIEQQTVDNKTGEVKSELVFNSQAQEYILRNYCPV